MVCYDHFMNYDYEDCMNHDYDDCMNYIHLRFVYC